MNINLLTKVMEKPIMMEVKSSNKEYFLNGKRHRENGPAVITKNDTKFWFQNGELHREDGPAVIFADGTKKWFKYNMMHREDGPALECSDGTQEWWLMDYQFNTKEKYDKALRLFQKI